MSYTSIKNNFIVYYQSYITKFIYFFVISLFHCWIFTRDFKILGKNIDRESRHFLKRQFIFSFFILVHFKKKKKKTYFLYLHVSKFIFREKTHDINSLPFESFWIFHITGSKILFVRRCSWQKKKKKSKDIVFASWLGNFIFEKISYTNSLSRWLSRIIFEESFFFFFHLKITKRTCSKI